MLTATAMSVTADPATNRISGLSYDANGNVTNLPGVGAHTYDGRNRVTSVAGGSARGYDPGNKKVWWKDAQANLYVDFYGPGGKLGTYQLFMPTNGSAVPLFNKVPEYTYFAGRLVKGEGPWTNGFVQQDRLGSAVTHLPYGDERTVTAQGRLKFATYWREDSGVDYADQRYYSSTYGRFLTSDPYRASGGPSDPGSWNRYAYVQGDPVNFNDPEGLLKASTTSGQPLPWWYTGSSGSFVVGSANSISALSRVFNAIDALEGSDQFLGWRYSPGLGSMMDLSFDPSAFGAAGFLPAVLAGAGAAGAGGTIVIAGGPVSWTVIGGAIVLTGVTIAIAETIQRYFQQSQAGQERDLRTAEQMYSDYCGHKFPQDKKTQRHDKIQQAKKVTDRKLDSDDLFHIMLDVAPCDPRDEP